MIGAINPGDDLGGSGFEAASWLADVTLQSALWV